MKEPPRPQYGSRIVDRVPVNGAVQPWPSNTVRYISRSWRGPVHLHAEGVDFNLRYVALHEHVGSGRYPRHTHPHSELMLVLDGEGVIETDRRADAAIPVKPGDLLVFPPRMVHQSSWSLPARTVWRSLMIDFDIGLEVARMPMEEGEHVEIGFVPFYDCFFSRGELQMPLSGAGWPAVAERADAISGLLSRPGYGVGGDLIASVLQLIVLFSRAAREQGRTGATVPLPPMFSRQAALLKARTLIEHRAWFDPGSVSRLAREVGMSDSHFIREFHAAFGLSPKQYSQRVLMRRACALLQRTDLPVKAIAERLGYHDPAIFSRAFARNVGVSPVHFRRQADS